MLNLRYWGAVLAVLGAVAAPGAAQAAAPAADLAVSLHGVAVPAGDQFATKGGAARILNNSGVTATGVTLDVDTTGVDTAVLTVTVHSGEGVACTEKSAGHHTCTVPDIAAHQFAEVHYSLEPVLAEEVPAPAGTLRVTVAHDGTDPRPADDTATAPLAIVPSGPDLTVGLSAQTIRPGRSISTNVLPWNFGKFVRGYRYTAELPEKLYFLEGYGCTFSADKRTANCVKQEELYICDGCPTPVTGGFIIKAQPDAPALTTVLMRMSIEPINGGEADPSDNSTLIPLRIGTPLASPSASVPASPGSSPSRSASASPSRSAPVSPSASVSPSSSVSPSASPSASASPSVTGVPGTGGGGGSLPITGPGGGILAAGGVALIGAGVLAYAAGRRREQN